VVAEEWEGSDDFDHPFSSSGKAWLKNLSRE
jgi:hypothetical protein